MVKTSDKKYARRRTPSVERGASAPSGESSSLINALAGFAAGFAMSAYGAELGQKATTQKRRFAMTAFCKEVTANYPEDRIKPSVVVSYLGKQHCAWHVCIDRFIQVRGITNRFIVVEATGKTRVEALTSLRERWLAFRDKEKLQL